MSKMFPAFLGYFCWKTPIPIKFLVLGGGRGFFGRGVEVPINIYIYIYGRGDFSDHSMTGNEFPEPLFRSCSSLLQDKFRAKSLFWLDRNDLFYRQIPRFLRRKGEGARVRTGRFNFT